MEKNIIFKNYFYYLQYLKDLASLPTVLNNSKNIKKALEICKKTFQTNLSNYRIYYDKQNNLIAFPQKIDLHKDLVYLSAHIDTVNANPKEWDPPFHPWKIYENEKELVGRGVNDCKAGVAFQLFLSYLTKNKLINLNNLVFTITFKEEGAGKKTSIEIGKEIGKTLPISKKSTYLFVLENNVSVNNPPLLSIYSGERGNFVVKIIDYLLNLQKIIRKLKHWNPVSIFPTKTIKNQKWQIKKQKGGHACSIPREKNLLTKIILESQENSIIKAGDEKNFAVIPTEIKISKDKNPQKHTLVISNRSFDTIKQVEKQLKGIQYKALKDFSISQGFNIESKFLKNKIYKILEKCKNESEVKIKYIYNIGGSDATGIYATLNPKFKRNFIPLIMGPGSRSQRNKNPQRLTHGKNETFDKESGEKAIIYIIKVLNCIN